VPRTEAAQVPERFHVRVTKDYLVFSAAHFITFAGNICERLHGHNYRVAAEVEGPLDENQYVVDFIALRDILREIVNELDHHVLLPTDHPTIHVVATTESVEATFEERRWVFPRGDCVLLPVANTTAELLARYIGRRLIGALTERSGISPQRTRIEVDECEGQWGVWESTS
jgi:6-pyruvoyltetrahydropterin/6-carboxytetrahydropterin synthase